MPSETEERPRPKLIVIAGPNGAGKTTLTERALAHEWLEGCDCTNPDRIAQCANRLDSSDDEWPVPTG